MPGAVTMSIIKLDRSDQLIFQQSHLKDLMVTDNLKDQRIRKYKRSEMKSLTILLLMQNQSHLKLVSQPLVRHFEKNLYQIHQQRMYFEWKTDAFPSTKIANYSDTDDEESPPRTQGDIMGYSNEDNGDDDGDDDDDDREQDEGTEEKNLVPDTDEGLKEIFTNLFIKFTREKQYEHGHELTELLDEMLDRGLVTPIEYNNLNGLIFIPDKSANEEEEKDEMTRVIKDTVDHVIQHDKEELSDLLMELRD